MTLTPSQKVALIRGAIMFLGVLFGTNTIPTGVDGGGKVVAGVLASIAVSIPAGDKNNPDQDGVH